ncbi:cysteine hydrolase [Stenotrophomonas rhizophila]|jgi:nicotinamidase-related amidase|uniref:isochorismatase family cysteine hydrolase n=1 Tax=Stenotrophomonas rhizophila TaxID=216778 RepID=UPI00201CCEE0|nr:isochorismatase family cysteine hydrolase [Stenotrophomonas rhizophila]UQY89231.1 cysteine hydrolase [Stenotrophomonas rhizophila]
MSGRVALLIIDVFSLFDFPNADLLAPSAVASSVEAARIRHEFDRRNLPVIYANDNFGNWQRDFPQLVKECLKKGGPSAEIAKNLGPRPGHYFVLKPKHSAFLATALPVLLSKLQISNLVLCGMALDSCVLATALDANSREYRTIIAADAVAALPDRRELALQLIKVSDAADVLTTEAILKAL